MTNGGYTRGGVVLVLFPSSDLHTARRRPALVLQADNLETGLPQLVIAMMTSRVFRGSHPSRVVVRRDSEAGRSAGVLSDSVVMIDNLGTVQLTEIDRQIGQLPMSEVDQALRHTLGLTD